MTEQNDPNWMYVNVKVRGVERNYRKTDSRLQTLQLDGTWADIPSFGQEDIGLRHFYSSECRAVAAE